MGEFDPRTGWTELSAGQVRRYHRALPDRPVSIDDRLVAAGLDYYWDVYGGLHTRTTQGVVWELLSGRPDTRPPVPQPPPRAQEWITITDLGMVFDPPAAPNTVLQLLCEEGLVERVGGHYEPTAAAEGLYVERRPEQSLRFAHLPRSTQRRWSYEVLARLRARAREVNADLATQLHPVRQTARPSLIQLTLKYSTHCAHCNRAIAHGHRGWWDPSTKSVFCERCHADD